MPVLGEIIKLYKLQQETQEMEPSHERRMKLKMLRSALPHFWHLRRIEMVQERHNAKNKRGPYKRRA